MEDGEAEGWGMETSLMGEGVELWRTEFKEAH